MAEPRPSLWERIRESSLYRSIYRTRYPDQPRWQSMVILQSLALHLHPVRVPKRATRLTYTWGLGGLSVWLFLILTFTGVFLMFYYVPDVPGAYFSIQNLATSVTFGQFMRNLHRWAAHAMVLLVFMHMTRVFLTGAYKPPREYNWMVGVGLLVLTFLLSFTGYLLPWDQLALWAITVGTNMAGSTPLVGGAIRTALLGGFSVGPATLVRWYTLHVIFLPLALIVGMSIHFWRIRKDGGISTPIYEEEEIGSHVQLAQ
ncbi:MAG: selenite/tellurite reduction operon b-type cytochrome ExtP [Bacillota bacterium]|nr:selenite/tellurite reduction operon b-type cytochrome ExtP [Bacillota bacterium]